VSRKLAGTAVVLVASLACAGCGGSHDSSAPAIHRSRPATETSRTAVISGPQTRLALPAAANFVILPPQSGAGNEDMGTFTAAGTVYFEFSCKGKGPLTLVGIISHISPCNGSPTGVSIPYHAGERVPLTVRASHRTTWRIAVGEHVPGAELVLVHSSGSGPAHRTFGPFRPRGTITVAYSCTGHGNLDATVMTKSPAHGDGTSQPCISQTLAGSLGPMRPAGTFTIDVHASGKHVQWTVTVRETPAQ
jgi:hypothetical protein